MKLSVIGGGSYLWSIGFCNQFIRSPLADGLSVCLMDIDPEALDLVYAAACICNERQGSPVRFEKTTDLKQALAGADFVLVALSTGGLDAMRHDLEIPERYGVWHTVGDTVGPGGWSRAVRNIPVLYALGESMSQLCPDAWMINVSNPLTVLTRTPERCFGIKTIGMCPGVENQVVCLARLAGHETWSELDYVVTGVDHGSWFTRIVVDGHDVLEELKTLGYCRGDGLLPSDMATPDPHAETAHTRVAFAVWRELGYLPSIGDRHIVENFPWFVPQTHLPLPLGLKRTSIAERRVWRAGKKREIEAFVAADGDPRQMSFGHGDDPVMMVVESLCGLRSFLYGANVMNGGQIPGFPEGAVVETRCRFDGSGVHPLVSPMPTVPACFTLPTVFRQEAIIDIALHGSFDELVALVLTDPLCSRMAMNQCRHMMRDLLAANRTYIPNPRLLEF